VVGVTDPSGRVSRFSRQEPLLFYQVAPVPDPLHFFSGSAGNRARASGSVAGKSDHWATEAVDCTSTD
jgi:hypothetical protein